MLRYFTIESKKGLKPSNELEMPIHKIFKTFKKEPLAAASIAQVHFATTIEGRKVAVKILRPKMENAFEKDINFFYWLVKVAESIKPELQKLNLTTKSKNLFPCTKYNF